MNKTKQNNKQQTGVEGRPLTELDDAGVAKAGDVLEPAADVVVTLERGDLAAREAGVGTKLLEI